MVVDLTEIGFPIAWGVGDGDRIDRQSGSFGVGGKNHRAGPRDQPAFVKAHSRFRPALNARNLVQVDGVRSTDRRGAVRRGDLEDLDGRVTGTQVAVRDQPFDRFGAVVFTEMRDALDPRRAFDRLVHEYRPGRARRFAVEVVAHHQIVDALTQQGLRESVRRASVGDETLHRIERANGAGRGQRDRITHCPRRTRQCLKRLVTRQAPDLAAEWRSRDDQGTFCFRSG